MNSLRLDLVSPPLLSPFLSPLPSLGPLPGFRVRRRCRRRHLPPCAGVAGVVVAREAGEAVVAGAHDATQDGALARSRIETGDEGGIEWNVKGFVAIVNAAASVEQEEEEVLVAKFTSFCGCCCMVL